MEVNIAADIPDLEMVYDFELNVSDIILNSGEASFLTSGPRLSIDNPLRGAQLGTVNDNFEIILDSELNQPQVYNQNIILPVDTSQSFTLSNPLAIRATEDIPGVTQGLIATFEAGTQISRAADETNDWFGEIEAPTLLSIPDKLLFPENFVPQRRISVGSDSVALAFDRLVTLQVPIRSEGLKFIYASQDGTDWTLQATCVAVDGFCTFRTNHFTQFTLGVNVTEDNTVVPANANGSGGGQNHARNGDYDPRVSKQGHIQFSTPQENIQTIYKRSARAIRHYSPCDFSEDEQLGTRLYSLKLSQRAPRTCRENIGIEINQLPYRTFKK